MTFYYHQLKSEAERQVYQALKKAVENHTDAITIQNDISGTQISQVFMYLLLDYPDFFWTKGDFTLYEEAAADGTARRLRLSYLYDEKESQQLGEQIQESLAKICGCIEDDANPEAIVRSIAAWFRENVSYSVMPGVDQTIYSALVMKKSVCMGISKAIMLSLRLYGIESIVVLGSLFHEGVHAWNKVWLDDTWYYLDVAAGYECFDRVWAAHGIKDRKPLILVKAEAIEETHGLRGEIR